MRTQLFLAFLACLLAFNAIAQTERVRLDVGAALQALDLAARGGEPQVELPWFDGATKPLVVIEEANQFEPGLAAKYPQLTSYRVTDAQGETYGRLNRNGSELYAVLLRTADAPVTLARTADSPDPSDYTLSVADLDAERTAFACEVDGGDKVAPPGAAQQRLNNCFVVGTTFRVFRMALTNTGEFAGLNGGTLAGVNTAFNNRLAELNTIYESEIAVRFVLIAGNDALVNLDASTDPFTDPNTVIMGSAVNTSTNLTEGENYIESLIAVGDYDIGHTINQRSGGVNGIAGLGVVCNSSAKARGFSTVRTGASLVIFQHEIGHQFNCQHTNYGCDGVKPAQRYEPGQGVTIMGTATPDCTGTDDYDSRNNNYFNVGSLQAIENTITATGCASTVASGNAAPSSDASFGVMNSTIPARTPFVLVGGGSDADPQVLSYNWEDYNTDGVNELNPDLTATVSTAPLFRSFAPSASSTRYFPRLSDILSGTLSNGEAGETLPQVSRTLNFRLTVRDGAGGNACDQVGLNVIDTGSPFRVTSQNTASSWTANNSNTETITWDVAGTNANGINAANVDIFLSTDGGQTFSFTLAQNTPNDGSHTFQVPSFATTQGRVMVRGSGYLFFDINDAPITITTAVTCDAAAVEISPTTAVTAPAGDAALNLSLSPQFGSQLTSPISIIVDSGDPTGNSAANDGSGACNDFTPQSSYDANLFLYTGSTGTYTFGSTGSTMPTAFRVASIFQPAFQNACTDFVGGINNISGVGVFSTGVSLTEGLRYNLVAFGVNSGNLGTLSVSFSGGTLFDGVPSPGAGFFYTYAVLNGGGTISAFSANSDLSNATTFPAGSYTIYGVSVENGTNLSPYVGGTLANFQNAIASTAICAAVSTNTVSVTIQAPLPVELVEFSGQALDAGNHLTWATAAEIGTERFVVERSTTSLAGSWEQIDQVAAAGEASEYRALDAQPGSGVKYYRLRMVDFDGYEAFSDVVALTRVSEADDYAVFPNPFRDGALTLRVPDSGSGSLSARVVSPTGQVVSTRVFEKVTAGQTLMELDVRPGTYVLQLQRNGATVHTARIVRLP